jgi:hypothetical protein
MDSVIYTDGHGIRVTNREFISGEKKYLIEGIVSARMNLIKAKVAQATLLSIAGLLAVTGGVTNFFSTVPIGNFTVGNVVITPNILMAALGAILFVAGIMWIITTHNSYAVHITTAEGEKEPIVSEKKDYVAQIVSAINIALFNR